MNSCARTRIWFALAAPIALAACAGSRPQSGASANKREASGSGRVVEVAKLPSTHQELLRAYGAGGDEWEAARERALADRGLTQFLVENLFLELVRAHRALGGADGERAQRARDRARTELARLGEPAAPTLAAALELADDVAAELAAQTLGAIGRPALGATVELLTSKQANARQRAAHALARMAHGAREEPRVRQALVKAGRDSEWFVRAQVARALGARGARDVETAPWRVALEKLLVDDDEAVVEAAALGLVELADPQAIGALVEALARTSEDGQARKFNAVQAALVRLSGVGAQPSVQAWRTWWRANRSRLERGR